MKTKYWIGTCKAGVKTVKAQARLLVRAGDANDALSIAEARFDCVRGKEVWARLSGPEDSTIHRRAAF